MNRFIISTIGISLATNIINKLPVPHEEKKRLEDILFKPSVWTDSADELRKHFNPILINIKRSIQILITEKS